MDSKQAEELFSHASACFLKSREEVTDESVSSSFSQSSLMLLCILQLKVSLKYLSDVATNNLLMIRKFRDTNSSGPRKSIEVQQDMIDLVSMKMEDVHQGRFTLSGSREKVSGVADVRIFRQPKLHLQLT